MKVLMIGQGPLPSSSEPFCSFPQLRTWSIYNMLQKWCKQHGHTIELVLVHDGTQTVGLNVYAPTDMTSLYNKSSDCDVVVTAGPFYPFIALMHLPNHIPLWLDYPSDPLADRDARNRKSPLPKSEWSFLSELTNNALHRADAMGVISKRQHWASIGQRLGISAPDIPISYTPIAFEFPSPMRSSTGTDILLAGSNNAWLNIEKLNHRLHGHTIHCTGITVPGLSSTPLPPQWNQYGWLSPTDLDSVIDRCQFGVWADEQGIEPLLGSRTRALFYIWNGLTPVGDTTTELASTLHKEGHMSSWADETPLSSVNIVAAKQYCQKHFEPRTVYNGLLEWLDSPSIQHKRPNSSTHEENLRLRETLRKIHTSPTWRIGSTVHQWINNIRSVKRK